VVITRPSTIEWINALKMRGFPGNYANQRLDWAPGSRNLVWDRIIEQVDGSKITVDAPITTAIEKRYGGGMIARTTAMEPLSHIGIENITFVSESAPGKAKDEDHSWIAIALDHVEDAWIRRVTMRGFAGSAIRVGPRARRVTIETCQAEKPVSETAGYRRQNFLIEGQQVLVRDCRSEAGMNDFAAGLLAAGPNVFLSDTSTGSLGPSGAFESWSSGVLYEKVKIGGSGIRLANDSSRAQGAGWTAANSVIWNSEGTFLDAKGPEGAENVVQKSVDALYEDQLFKRLGVRLESTLTLPITPEKTGSLGIESWRTEISGRRPVSIVNGRFAMDGKALWGGMINDGWWRGHEDPAVSLDVGGNALTRFIPGRVGPGLTEDLNALAQKMLRERTPFYQMVPGLWYDRRRDEHSINSREDGNVWAPFYEMPWARSGEGTAADGLSKFDLTKFNPWYFDRLKQFGKLASAEGFVLYYNLYNMHNTLEIPPHWVDYPWRPANNINNTGLPEPPPIVNGRELHVGNEVYDISNPVRRELHRALILHSLDELGDLPNVFFNVGFQFAAPLAFQQFFQDTVAEWEKKTGKHVRLQIATAKDTTDAILADPVRSKQIAVIDMRYWQYMKDGKLFAPEGGKNLAFRELIRASFPGFSDTPPDTTPQMVYKMVREYHAKYPDKAIVAWNGGAGWIPVLMAGGAQVLMRNPAGGHGQGRQVDHVGSVPTDVLNMQPIDGLAKDPEHTWCMTDPGERQVLIYSMEGASIELTRDLALPKYNGLWIDPRTDQTIPKPGAVGRSIAKPTAEPWLLLLTR
jgi:hypothetical protein